MSKPVVLITGANGQLGKELRVLADAYAQFSFLFVTREELPVEQPEQVKTFFNTHQPAYCINCAAYTAVDKAEAEKERAFAVNGDAVGILATTSLQNGCKFIHVSTDYVFDGTSSVPYTETTPTNPVNTYGLSKLKGEALGLLYNPETIIVRTAWVYSAFGNNFVKTMLRLMKDRPDINVVNDQVGAPTYAADLALALMLMVSKHQWDATTWQPGVYHYSNAGRISWYEFAVAIKELSGSTCNVHPIPTSQYPTPAKRPSFSLLNTEKIQAAYNLQIPEWKDGLVRCLEKIKEQQ